jgi:phage FluMu gp28-like protein
MQPTEESGPLLRYSGTAGFNLAPVHRRRADMQDWIDAELAPALAALDPDRRHVIGMDFARSGDMTCIVVAELRADLRRTWRLVVELHNVPYDQQDQVLAWIEGFEAHAGGWRRTGRGAPRLGGEAIDSTGNGEVIGEHAHDRRGSQVIQVKISESWYREQMPRYKVAIEDRTTRLIRHDDILEDHRAVQLVRGVPRVAERKTDARGQRHGDSAVAGCLANQAADEGVAEYAYHPVLPARERRAGDHLRSRRTEETAAAAQPRTGALRGMLRRMGRGV